MVFFLFFFFFFFFFFFASREDYPWGWKIQKIPVKNSSEIYEKRGQAYIRGCRWGLKMVWIDAHNLCWILSVTFSWPVKSLGRKGTSKHKFWAVCSQILPPPPSRILSVLFYSWWWFHNSFSKIYPLPLTTPKGMSLHPRLGYSPQTPVLAVPLLNLFRRPCMDHSQSGKYSKQICSRILLSQICSWSIRPIWMPTAPGPCFLHAPEQYAFQIWSWSIFDFQNVLLNY